MGIQKNLGNLGVFVLIIIVVAILSSGCTSKSEKTNMSIATTVHTTTPTPTSEIPKVVKLKIMSVTAGQATISQIPLTIKVKNIGDGVAKDVYVGGIKIFFMPKNGNFTNRSELVEKGVFHVLRLPTGQVSYRIDTGTLNPDYNSNDPMSFENLTVGIDRPKSLDYIGDILPGEVKEGHISQIVSSTESTLAEEIYVKVAWTDDTKEFTIY